MTGSGIFRLNLSDLARGLVLAVLTAVLTSCQQAISSGNMDPSAWDWRAIGGVALAAIVAYLLKNLVSDEQGKVLGRIGVVLLLLAAGGALTGCSSLISGLAVGGAGGVDGPGAAAVKVTQTPSGCPDLGAQGSIPAQAISLDCQRSADGTIHQHADIGGLTPENVLLAGMQAQAAQAQATAQLLQQLVPIVAQAAATAAGGPAAGAVAGALTARPPASAPVPLLPTLPGPAAP
jgi:hypothetical protein